MVRKLRADHNPSHWATVFDLGAPRERLAILPSYKEHRPPTPPALESQLPGIREMLAAMRIPVVEQEGVEADDIIATLATCAAAANQTVLIASSDKDFLQLINPSILMIRPEGKQSALIDSNAVISRYGVRPDQMVDYLSLLGDAVDNVPGVPGVGEKTAAELLRQFGTIDNLLTQAADIPRAKLRDTIVSQAERLHVNRALIALHADVKLSTTLDMLKVSTPDIVKLRSLCQQFGFKSLLKDFEDESVGIADLFATR